MLMLKSIMTPLQLKFLMDVRVIATASILLAATGASPASADALPGAEMSDPAVSKTAVPLSTSESASPDTVVRQHVKHLRAHKKTSSDASSDQGQMSAGDENLQSSGSNPLKADDGKKSAAAVASSSANAQAVVKPRPKISRPRTIVTPARSPGPRAVPRVVRERDFFSDMFAGDE